MKVRFLFSVLILLISVSLGFSQTFPVRGKVVLRKSDGTTIPVADALVEAYRTDVSRGKMPSAKTDKKGNFSFAGFPLGQVFAIVVSAPGIRPEIYPNVRAGMEDITITVFEGDGKVLTEEEVRRLLQGAATPQAPQPGLSEEQKRAIEEEEKRRAEFEEKKRKIEQTNATIRRALQEGIDALNAKNYELAIAKFDEGINADPEFVGSVPVLQTNKAVALNRKAVDKYNQVVREKNQAVKNEAISSIKSDLLNAIAATERALQVLESASATGNQAAQAAQYEEQKYRAISIKLDSYRLLFRTTSDTTKVSEALKTLAEYEALEKDKAQVEKARLGLADALREAGDAESAIPIYRKVLEGSPENYDAMAGLGLCLFSVGVAAQNKEQMQEGLDIMQRFADSAPDTHPLKSSVKDAVEYLKMEEKLTPQKTRPTQRRRGQ